MDDDELEDLFERGDLESVFDALMRRGDAEDRAKRGSAARRRTENTPEAPEG